MHSINFQTFKENISLSKSGFIVYSPISILAFPVTVLVINPRASLLMLTACGFALTTAMFICYLPFIWIQNRINPGAVTQKLTNFLFATISIGALRGYLFYLIVIALDLKAPGDLLNRILASAATTVFWLSIANILINFSRTFRKRYQESLNRFIKRNLTAVPALMPSDQSTDELASLQEALSNSLAARLEDGDAENLREIAELLKSKINLQLRPLSRRIWLRSLNEYPVIRFRQMLRDCIQFLDFSKPVFLSMMLFLALLSNVFIRAFSESVVRTLIFFVILLFVMSLSKTRVFSNTFFYLAIIGFAPVIGSEYASGIIGYNGSWTATLLISLVAPALIIVLSLFNLTLRDHELIIELLENYEIQKHTDSSKSFDAGERHLASYLHNSLQSELLAVAGQLEDAAVSNDRMKSSEILQRVSSLINRSFIDDFQKFSESPLERLQTIRNSWSGILEITIDITEALLNSPERNAILVQTIEEFAANSFRHGKATQISASAKANSIGLQLTLRSNGTSKISTKRGLGSEWLDQIALTPWKMQSTRTGTILEITIQ
jgi:signal transduction histidine kinase